MLFFYLLCQITIFYAILKFYAVWEACVCMCVHAHVRVRARVVHVHVCVCSCVMYSCDSGCVVVHCLPAF